MKYKIQNIILFGYHGLYDVDSSIYLTIASISQTTPNAQSTT